MKDAMNRTVFFQPTFGNRPESIVGRDGEIGSFIQGLKEPVGSRERCTLFLGQRGMGKTALLLELEDRAKELGFVVARVTAHEGLKDEIIEQIQLNGAQFFSSEKKRITGINAGALGFSFGLSFQDATRDQFGFRSKLTMLCDRLSEKGKGVLILIDEVHTSKEMREVASSFQELVGERKNIAMAMAGLPYAVSGVLNDKVLTFLNRAKKVELGPISNASVEAYYERAFDELGIKYSDDLVKTAACKTRGIPYLMQLIGYYLVQFSNGSRIIKKETIDKAENAAIIDLENNVFRPIINPLSDNDRLFIQAMAEIGDKASTNEIMQKLGENGPAFQVYRKRLIDSGIIEAPRKGELIFAVPYLSEYLRQNPI